MRVFRLTLAVALLAVVSGAFTPVSAQQGSVTGVVRDAATGEPLVGVQMVIVGTNIGAPTNQEGRYLIPNVPTGERLVRALIIGYAQAEETVQVSAGAPAVADFTLATSAINLSEIVVNASTGRAQRARELGSNVANIELADVNQAVVTNLGDALSGRAAGIDMRDVNGSVGTSQRIRIRGANSLSLSNAPLIFVDGVQISQSQFGFGLGGQEPSRLNDINPADIQNMEVIKGPAASALYGTAAANGVILITTKQGRPGDTRWEFFAETGEAEDVTDYPANFATFQIDDPGLPIFTSSGALNGDAVSLCPNWAAADELCTQDQTISFNTGKDPRTSPFITGPRERIGLAVSGGDDRITFRLSGTWEDEQGVLALNTQEKFNIQANLDAGLSDNADLSFSVLYADSDLQLPINDNAASSAVLNMLFGYPNLRVDSEGNPSVANYGFGRGPEDYNAWDINQQVDRFTSSMRLQYRPTDWLTVNGSGGLDFNAQTDTDTQQSNSPLARFGGLTALGYRDVIRSNVYFYTARTTATAGFELTPELTSTTTVGASYDQSTSRRNQCFGATLVLGTESCSNTSTNFAVDEFFSEIKTVGAYAQQEFGWRDRVFLSAAIRGDDNSAFGADFGLVYYPAASLSWVVAEETWFPEQDFVSDLRLRGAWGQSGLRPGFRDAVTLYSPVPVARETGNVSGVVLDVTGNTTLEPEISTEVEFGFDAGLFNNRLSAEFTYFDKTSEDALISRRLPGSLGLTTSVFENLGEIENSGTELTLNLDVYQSDQLGVNLGFTNTTLSNEIVELGEGVDPITLNRGLQRHEEGYTAGGFWQVPYTFEDSNGDGFIGFDEVTYGEEEAFIGPSIPKWQRSVFADVRVSDWITISTLFNGKGGHYQGNDGESFRCLIISTRNCSAVADPNTSLANQARAVAYLDNGTLHGWIEEADFWRWSELSIAFDMPTVLTNQVSQFEGLRLTLAGRNLAVFTDYTGLDPEANETGASTNFHASEFNTQPPVRYLMLRLDYRF